MPVDPSALQGRDSRGVHEVWWGATNTLIPSDSTDELLFSFLFFSFLDGLATMHRGRWLPIGETREIKKAREVGMRLAYLPTYSHGRAGPCIGLFSTWSHPRPAVARLQNGRNRHCPSTNRVLTVHFKKGEDP